MVHFPASYVSLPQCNSFFQPWIPENERDCYLGASLESQTTHLPLVDFSQESKPPGPKPTISH